MKDQVFFDERLFEFLRNNDSMFNKFITTSIKYYSYLIANDFKMEIKFQYDYEIYLYFKRYIKNKVYNNWNEFFNLIEEFLKEFEFKNKKIFIKDNKCFELSDNKIESTKIPVFNKGYNVNDIKKQLTIESRKSSYIDKILRQIRKEIFLDRNKKYRIIVESDTYYEKLIRHFYQNKKNVSFKDYYFLFNFINYIEVIKYLEKFGYDREILLNKCKKNENDDYISYFFNEFLTKMIINFTSEEQLLFYLYLYKNLYLVRKYNENSNILIEYIRDLSILDCNNFLILTTANTFKYKEECRKYFDKICYSNANLKVYLDNNKVTNDYYTNFLEIIKDE